ncbi:hypothetical protein SRB5_35290 [Streptomyces sp. RB5]|uniref:DUF3592 domain-containing protein n=1 Tax=Streptomyces smaragdinus TaxID=2585196 RepID=A0A7K0CIZ3_9ACTN|nr:hypothetical protein [Streptomyces smaragdinus]MQY13381.1 hypothetical protein [Streptomyces smaragdinus]
MSIAFVFFLVLGALTARAFVKIRSAQGLMQDGERVAGVCESVHTNGETWYSEVAFTAVDGRRRRVRSVDQMGVAPFSETEVVQVAYRVDGPAILVEEYDRFVRVFRFHLVLFGAPALVAGVVWVALLLG